MPLGEYLTTADVAERLGVKESRVRQFCLAGRLEPTKIGTQLFFDKAVVARFARKKRRPGRPKKT